MKNKKLTLNEELSEMKRMMGLKIYEEVNDEGNEETDVENINALNNIVDNIEINQDEETVELPDQNNVQVEYNFNVSSKNLLDKSIDTIKKMSRKLSIPEPEITIGEPRRTGVDYDDIWGEFRYYVNLYPVKIVIQHIFKLQEYEVIAVVDNQTGGSVTIGDEVAPNEYMTPSKDCDYCKTKRNRGKSWIVKKIETNEYKRFGGDCVKKVFGINPAKYIKAIDFFNRLNSLFGGDGEENERGGGERRSISPKMRVIPFPIAVAVVKMALDERGYIKKEGEWEERGNRWNSYQVFVRTNQGQATGDLCDEIMLDDERVHEIQPNNELAEQLKEFWANYNITNEGTGFGQFLVGVKNLITNSGEFRIVDCAKLIYGLHKFIQERDRPQEEPIISNYLGEVGQKMTFRNLKLTGHKSFVSQFGDGNIWMFEDENGNRLKKFGELSTKFRTSEGTEELHNGFKKGDMFTFTADVKKHEDYRGEKSTILGRLSAPPRNLQEIFESLFR